MRIDPRCGRGRRCATLGRDEDLRARSLLRRAARRAGVAGVGSYRQRHAARFHKHLPRRGRRPPAELWRAITQLPRWWNGSHTYSGQASNLSLDVQAGGCWCERWGDGQSVEHGRVVLVMPQRTLRVDANLGPLQELPVHGVLTFTIAMQEQKTILRLT